MAGGKHFASSEKLTHDRKCYHCNPEFEKILLNEYLPICTELPSGNTRNLFLLDNNLDSVPFTSESCDKWELSFVTSIVEHRSGSSVKIVNIFIFHLK